MVFSLQRQKGVHSLQIQVKNMLYNKKVIHALM